ncbi:MAG: hypothetical protein ACO391_12875 [Pseudomonadales bacterium]
MQSWLVARESSTSGQASAYLALGSESSAERTRLRNTPTLCSATDSDKSRPELGTIGGAWVLIGLGLGLEDASERPAALDALG